MQGHCTLPNKKDENEKTHKEMSRQHRNTSNVGAAARALQECNKQVSILKSIRNSMVGKMSDKMHHSATVCMYLATYLANEMDELKDALDGDNCPFAQKLRNKTAAIVREAYAFVDLYEPLIAPESRKMWADSYGSFQQGMDNYFTRERRYEMEGERGREICFAASLRYHDPYETNAQRVFEDGFRKGAAYADLHPAGTVRVRVGGKEAEVPIQKVLEDYARMVNPKASVTVEVGKGGGR